MGSYGSYGFPPGYFILRSEASGSRVLDVYMNKTQDGVAVGLWPEKDLSLVEGLFPCNFNHSVVGPHDLLVS